MLGGSATTIGFRHASSWKPEGAFVVRAATRDGRGINLVFKKVVATPTFNPVLHDLPYTPGPPEYAVFASSSEQLAPYLPKVFLAQELEPRISYVFLMEQIGDGYRKASNRDAVEIVQHLRSFHEALADHIAQQHRHLAVDYLAIENELPDFYRRRLQEYFANTGDHLIAKVLKEFDLIEAIYRARPNIPEAVGMVHGDPNLANIRVPTDYDGVPRFFDWEWAGTHILHTDVAAILKFANPTIERKAISAYAESIPQISPEIHRRLYYWCKLDRSLLDVALMATLCANPAPRRLNVGSFLRRSARAAMHAYLEFSQLGSTST